MDKIRLAYFAGLFDGEGCISIKRLGTLYHARQNPAYFLEIRLRMCDPRAIMKFGKFFGISVRLQKSDTSGKKYRNRSIYTAYVTHNRALKLIKTLRPFLIVKRDEAMLAIQYHRLCVASYNKWAKGSNRRPLPKNLLRLRHRFYLKMHKLKHRIFKDATKR